MSVYRLGNNKLRIEIIDSNAPLLDIKSSRFMRPRDLRRIAGAFERSILCVTSTMPDVFFYIQVDDSNSKTYHMPYRVFLGFVAELNLYEEKATLDWLQCGF